MRRKLLGLAVGCVLTFFCMTTAEAVELTEYPLEELDFTISLPEDHGVFTRETDAEDPVWSAFGLEADSMLAFMESGDIYLNSIAEDIGCEIVLTVTQSSLSDFNKLGDTALGVMASSLEEPYQSMGITILKSELYQHKQAKFIKLFLSQKNEDADVYGLQYHTVYADKAINITLHSYVGEVSQDNVVLMKQVVDSIIFDAPPQTVELTPTDAFIYTDPKSQTSFTVPANWVQKEPDGEHEGIDAKFISGEDRGTLIMYSSSDIWSEMTKEEKAGQNRADVNNSMFSKSDIAVMYDTVADNVRMASYGQAEYYIVTGQQKRTLYDTELTVTMTGAVTIIDAYLYIYQFSGDSDHPLYKDFTKFLTSAEYHRETVENGRASYGGGAAPATGTYSNGSGEVLEELARIYSPFNIISSLFVTIAIYSLPIIVYRYGVRKAPVEVKKAKRIAIIYGIFAFILMSLLIIAMGRSDVAGGAIFLWSYVNYRMLTGGKKADEGMRAEDEEAKP